MHLTLRQAAQKLGLPATTLSTYVTTGKLPKPKSITSGRMTIHLWTEADVERARKLLPKIKNGRKTRYQKKQSATGTQQSAKSKSTTKKSQPRAAVPHEQRKKER